MCISHPPGASNVRKRTNKKCSVPKLIRYLYGGAALGFGPHSPKRVCVLFVAPPNTTYSCVHGRLKEPWQLQVG